MNEGYTPMMALNGGREDAVRILGGVWCALCKLADGRDDSTHACEAEMFEMLAAVTDAARAVLAKEA